MPQETPGIAELRAWHGVFLYAGLVDHSLLSSNQETIRPAPLIQFHGGQIADSRAIADARCHVVMYAPRAGVGGQSALAFGGASSGTRRFHDGDQAS